MKVGGYRLFFVWPLNQDQKPNPGPPISSTHPSHFLGAVRARPSIHSRADSVLLAAPKHYLTLSPSVPHHPPPPVCSHVQRSRGSVGYPCPWDRCRRFRCPCPCLSRLLMGCLLPVCVKSNPPLVSEIWGCDRLPLCTYPKLALRLFRTATLVPSWIAI